MTIEGIEDRDAAEMDPADRDEAAVEGRPAESRLPTAWRDRTPVIGMVHLRPLPGSPGYDGDRAAIHERALRDAEALVDGGVDGLIVENLGDAPYHPGRVPARVVAEMTSVATEVRRRVDVPLGINVLRNDGLSALAIAHAVDARFIRVNVLAGARVTDQGIVQGEAHAVMRERALLESADRERRIAVLADVDVKHSGPVGPYDLEQEVEDVLRRAGADAVVVSGLGTGKATEMETVRSVKIAAREAPVFVGSGVTPDRVRAFLAEADGAIVGTWFKEGGEIENPVDPVRVRELMDRRPEHSPHVRSDTTTGRSDEEIR